jgi:hypothetical protein
MEFHPRVDRNAGLEGFADFFLDGVEGRESFILTKMSTMAIIKTWQR